MEINANNLVPWLSNNWAIISTVAATISAVLVFLKNALTVAKLREEIESMRRAREIEEPLIRKASMEEIEKYGQSVTLRRRIAMESDGAKKHGAGATGELSDVIGKGLLILVAGVVVGVAVYLLIRSPIFRYVSLALSLLILLTSIIGLLILRRKHATQISLLNQELAESRKQESP